jgi:NAD(P)-dependent dehydrogenase (short-subunit alcohol dehydrogenase family)
MNWERPFDLSGQVAVVTGGGGVLCSTLSDALAHCGARVAVLDINLSAAETVAHKIQEQGGEALPVQVDVLDKGALLDAAQRVVEVFGRVDILLNGAGGNKREATTSETLSFFDLSPEAIRWVLDLNFVGTLLPSQVFGRHMVDQGSGCIINISSMAAFRPLTRTVAYSPAKAAVSNFTQWLAVHICHNCSHNIRVNAIAPGFFLTEQNRFLLTDQESGELTPRGEQILAHTPMNRFGDPQDLIGAVLWLLSEGASFVHGAVIPIDGGFSAYSGV